MRRYSSVLLLEFKTSQLYILKTKLGGEIYSSDANIQGHPTTIFGKYLFGRWFEIWNFRNICCKISCLPASPRIFEHLKNGIIAYFNGFLSYKGHLEFSGAFFLAGIFEKVSFDPYNFRDETRIPKTIDLVTVFDAVLTSWQTREKLQWLYREYNEESRWVPLNPLNE